MLEVLFQCPGESPLSAGCRSPLASPGSCFTAGTVASEPDSSTVSFCSSLTPFSSALYVKG